MSAFIKNYAIYVLWHNLGILICDFMQQKSSTDWQRLGMVVINCIKHSEVYLSWCNRYVAVGGVLSKGLCPFQVI
jgi:hypothetical protein